MEVRAIYESWLNESTLDDATRAELLAISADDNEIEERFYRELEFGTAGLRGILGAGTNRMNVYVVRRATQGLSNYLLGCDGAKERGVCIAYDSRLFSPEFAQETACVLAANGIKVYLFSTLHSVPQLSFALRHLGCMAGVVITASHNPSKYNGYKVYWAYGGQAAPEQAESSPFPSRSETPPCLTPSTTPALGIRLCRNSPSTERPLPMSAHTLCPQQPSSSSSPRSLNSTWARTWRTATTSPRTRG